MIYIWLRQKIKRYLFFNHLGQQVFPGDKTNNMRSARDNEYMP